MICRLVEHSRRHKVPLPRNRAESLPQSADVHPASFTTSFSIVEHLLEDSRCAARPLPNRSTIKVLLSDSVSRLLVGSPTTTSDSHCSVVRRASPHRPCLPLQRTRESQKAVDRRAKAVAPASIIAAIMPLCRQAPRPYRKVSSCRTGSTGGTVSRWVKSTRGRPRMPAR